MIGESSAGIDDYGQCDIVVIEVDRSANRDPADPAVFDRGNARPHPLELYTFADDLDVVEHILELRPERCNETGSADRRPRPKSPPAGSVAYAPKSR